MTAMSLRKIFAKKRKAQTDLELHPSSGSDSTNNPSSPEFPTITSSRKKQTVVLPSRQAYQTTVTLPQPDTHNRTEQYGLHSIHTPSKAATDGHDEDRKENCFDIVAVHGITGDAYKTWTHDNGTFWLRDLIPDDLQGVRVFSYGYPAEVVFSRATGSIDSYARSLLEALKRERRSKDEQTRPLIFICHSMGGIVVKKALIIAKIEDNLYENIRTSVTGILFLATPHRGSGATNFASVLTGIANVALIGTSRFTGRMRTELLAALEKDSNVLKDISTGFKNQTRDLHIASFIEQDVTMPVKSRIVDEASGVMDVQDERIVPMQGCDHRNICRFAGKESESYKTVLSVLQDWAEEINELEDRTTSNDDIECLRSLAFPEMFYRRQEADKAFSHTCEWILEHKSYTTWLSSKEGLLWIKGKPGSGKSTLMAFIFRALQQISPTKRSLSIDFFFHGRGTSLQKTPTGMFRSLLHQLYNKVPSVRSAILASFREKLKLGEAGSGWQWQLKELIDLFSRAVVRAAHLRAMTIFVDALDEAGAETARELAQYFQQLNNDLLDAKKTTKVCISCRHYPIVSIRTFLDVHVEDENHCDIAKYIEERLNAEVPETATCFPQDYQTLKDTITKKASGIFMWPFLIIPVVVRLIVDGQSFAFIMAELERVPPDLKDVYMHIIKNVILAPAWAQTLLLMQWICLAERPLSVTELRYAMASDDSQIKNPVALVDTDERMEKQIQSLSGGLAEVKKHARRTTVQFIHQSVNDFLRSEGLKYLISVKTGVQSRILMDLSGDEVIGQSQSRLCKSCVNYLKKDEVLRVDIATIPTTKEYEWGQVEERSLFLLKKIPFVLYAAKSWFLHAEKAESLGIMQQGLIEQFGSPPSLALRNWIIIFRGIEYGNPKLPQLDSTLLHVSASSNLQSVIGTLLASGEDVDTQNDAGETALLYAARWGHIEIVKILLDAGAEVGAKSTDQRTALVCAAANGHEATFRLLLDRGADVNDSAGENGDALQAAAKVGQLILVQLLLDNGANVMGARGSYYGSALGAAAGGGHGQVINRLLEAGADVNVPGGICCGSALAAAAARGHDKIVERLLEAGADLHRASGHFSALAAAAASGYDKIVERLLEAGADVNWPGGEHGTALMAAAEYGRDKIVERLLEAGADVNGLGGQYGTALGVAATFGHDKIVERLLETGADVNWPGGGYGTALWAAAEYGHDKIVERLLEAGADVNWSGGDYGTALRVAAEYGHDKIVERLLEAGADVNGLGGDYGTALGAAAVSGYDKIVERLLEAGADVNWPGGGNGTALGAAAEGGHDKIVERLLELGADVNGPRGEGYWSALAAAAGQGYEKIVERLLEAGADINWVGDGDGDDRTALQVATDRGHNHIVELLRSKGAV